MHDLVKLHINLQGTITGKTFSFKILATSTMDKRIDVELHNVGAVALGLVHEFERLHCDFSIQAGADEEILLAFIRR